MKGESGKKNCGMRIVDCGTCPVREKSTNGVKGLRIEESGQAWTFRTEQCRYSLSRQPPRGFRRKAGMNADEPPRRGFGRAFLCAGRTGRRDEGLMIH